jgi:four helix bundle protein
VKLLVSFGELGEQRNCEIVNCESNMPFIFENLQIYQKTLDFSEEIITLLKDIKGEPTIKDQLKRAAISVTLNIAEGAGRFTKAEKRSFYVIARGSIYECVVLQIMKRTQLLENNHYEKLYSSCETLSKMINGLINSLSEQSK